MSSSVGSSKRYKYENIDISLVEISLIKEDGNVLVYLDKAVYGIKMGIYEWTKMNYSVENSEGYKYSKLDGSPVEISLGQ